MLVTKKRKRAKERRAKKEKREGRGTREERKPTYGGKKSKDHKRKSREEGELDKRDNMMLSGKGTISRILIELRRTKAGWRELDMDPGSSFSAPNPAAIGVDNWAKMTSCKQNLGRRIEQLRLEPAAARTRAPGPDKPKLDQPTAFSGRPGMIDSLA